MASTTGVGTEQFPRGFIKSVMRHRHMDGGEPNQREKKATQEEQDAEDEKARKQAMTNLVNSWQERLQLISVITTFFASTEAAMLVNSKPASASDLENNILKASNAAFLGALILHAYAAVLSFLGAFLLINYKLREAKREEMIIEGIPVMKSPLSGPAVEEIERDIVELGLPQALTSNVTQPKARAPVNHGTTTSVPDSSHLVEPFIFSADPHIEQVGLFVSNVSHQLLSRIHAVCVFLAAVGFVLAIVGILCYAWALQPGAVSIFTSACMGGALLSMCALRI